MKRIFCCTNLACAKAQKHVKSCIGYGKRYPTNAELARRILKDKTCRKMLGEPPLAKPKVHKEWLNRQVNKELKKRGVDSI
jgi:hypothetical protein